MSMFKIVMERRLCTSCGNCVEMCPELWQIAEDGFSHLKKSQKEGENEERNLEELGCAVKAAENCPVAIIHVYRDGEEIS